MSRTLNPSAFTIRPSSKHRSRRKIQGVKFTATGFLLVLALLVPTLFVACAPQNEALARATAAHPSGRAIFEQYNCIRCHDGGNGGYGKRMIDNPRLRDLSYIKARIVNGKKIGAAQMPAFPDMPQKDLEEVAQFVRALGGWER
jgi:mono/diheme cytochrome c family protein